MIRVLCALLVMLSATVVSLAQTNSAAGQVRRLSLQDCLQQALVNNLELQVDRLDPKLSLYALKSAYGAYDPTLSIGGQHDRSKTSSSISDDNAFSSSLDGGLPTGTTYSLGTKSAITDSYSTTGTDASSGQVGLEVTQPLLKGLWIDDTRMGIKVAKITLKYSEQQFRLQTMQILTLVEKAYYDLIYDQEYVIVQEKAVELAKRLVVENRKRTEVGTLAQLDLQQAESQAATTEAALIEARSTLAVQEHAIKQLIVSNYSAWAEMVVQPSESLKAARQSFSRQDSWSKGLTSRPELLQAKLDIERAGIKLKYYKNQLFPELDVFGTYGYNGASREFSGALNDIQSTDHPFYTYGGKVSVPLSRTKARNDYKSQKVTLQQALLSLKKTESDIMVEIDDDIKKVQSSYEQVAATHAATEYAAAALDAEEKRLASGKSTTYTVLQMQRDLTTARGNEILALDNYNKQVAQLSLDEGSTMERLKIALQFQ